MKKMIITGHVGGNPELRTDQSGNQFANFSVGVNVGTKEKPKTDWVSISTTGKLTEITRMYIKKGDKVLVEGFPTISAYINKENQAIPVQIIYPQNIEILSKKLEDMQNSIDNKYSEGSEMNNDNAIP